MKTTDVAIVGGGVIGLSIAYELARNGLMSTVLDRGPLGRAASWAGAGIVAPPAGRATGDPDEALRTLSARLFPDWSEALRAETGLGNGYRRCGSVDVAFTGPEAAELEETAALWRDEAIPHDRLEPEDVARVEPGLTRDLRLAYHIPGRAQIRNPRHVRALEIACARRGVRLRPGLAAEGFEAVGDLVRAVKTSEGRLPCGRVVVAAGAWSGALLHGLGIPVPTPPVKGQIVLLRASRPPLGRIIEHGTRYLVPRDDGRVLIGATEEEAGFDTRTTPGGVLDLLTAALRLCPDLSAAEVERCWAGLRPGNTDGRPTIGPAPDFTNVLVATGHRRAGLQLSTGTAVIVADLILGRPPRLDLAPFRPGRPPGAPVRNPFRS